MNNDLEQLWQSLRESKLVAGNVIDKLIDKGKSTLMPDASVADGIEWLISKKAITKYQGKILASGKSGPFFYEQYKVQDRLTSGSFSGCFQASHVGSGYPVLLRFATTEMVADPQRWSRIAARISAQSRIEHDQLLKYFELVDMGAWKFVVFEARRGSAIGKKIDGGKKVNQKNACHLVRSAASALQQVHAANQVHGSVTPDVLFLGADGNCWVHRDPLVEPFAIGDNVATETAKLADYAAPELLSAEAHATTSPATPTSDIFSLGCVLYRMLSGTKPFPNSDPKEAPVELSTFGIDSAVADVVAKMMSVNPDDRPASMLAVSESLAPLVGKQKTSELPPPSDRLVKFKKLLKKKLLPSEPTGHAPETSSEATPAAPPVPTAPPVHPNPASPAVPVDPATPITSDATIAINPADTVAINATPVAPPIAPPVSAATVPTAAVATNTAPANPSEPVDSPTPPAPVAPATPPTAPTTASPLPPGVTALPPGVQPIADDTPPTAPPSTPAPQMPPGVTAIPADQPVMPASPIPSAAVAADPVPISPAASPIAAVAGAETGAPSLPVAEQTPVSQRRRKRGPKMSTIIGLVVAFSVLLGAMYFAKLALDAIDDGRVAEGEVEVEDGKDGENGDNETGETNGDSGNGDSGVTDTSGAFVQNVVADDPEQNHLWETPTVGPPITLDYVPSSLRMVLSLRPSQLFGNDDGKLIEQALGKKFASFEEELQRKTGVQFAAIDHLLVTFHDNDGAKPRPSFIVTLAAPASKEQLLVRWGNPSPVPLEGQTLDYYASGDDAFFIPAEALDDQQNVKQFVLTTVDQLVEMAGIDFAPPTMNIHLRTLLRKSDVQRHFTMLSTPSFLYNDEGQQLFDGEYVKGLDAIRWLIDRDVQALLFSSHLEDDWYLEVMLKGQVDRDPHQLSRDFESRIKDGSKMIASHAITLGSNPYWDQVRNYIAVWVRKLATGIRSGAEDRIMVANLWMPKVSAHNVVAGTELLLASSGPGTGGAETAMVTPKDPGPKMPMTLAELLEMPQSVDIPEDDLINAVNEVKLGVLDTVGGELPFAFDMVLKGTDLQTDGITQNQKVINFKMDAPLNEVLTALVVKANPDPNSTGPKDPLNKLIWVIGPYPKEPDKEVILITTRAAATRDAIELPAAFVAEPSEP